MMASLLQLPTIASMAFFIMQFYERDSQYLSTDQYDRIHTVHQMEGGEQGDPLMPMLYALGQHPAFQRVETSLFPGERIYAFLEDV